MDEITAYYARHSEEGRLESGCGALEFARTQELVLRYLPPPPATVVDIGGGTGAYSRWLAGLGHRVHLLDLAEPQVREARRRGGLRSSIVGDARALPYGEIQADAALLLGPLYHLTARGARMRALAEARRILRPGGLLFAAAISRYASLLDALAAGWIDEPGSLAMVERDLRDGQHRNEGGHPQGFTTAYFHRAGELAAEVREAGFHLIAVSAVEGPGWVARQLDLRCRDERLKHQLLGLLRRVEEAPELIGMSLHYLATARA